MKMERYTGYFYPNYVCSRCGGQNYHINLFFLMPDMVLHEQEDCPVWCHDCECEVDIVPPKEKINERI